MHNHTQYIIYYIPYNIPRNFKLQFPSLKSKVPCTKAFRVCTHSGILFSLKDKKIMSFCRLIDETKNHHAKPSEADSEMQISHVFSYI